MSELLNLASDLARLLVLDFNRAPRWRGKRNDCTKDFELLLKGLAAYAYLRQWKLSSHKKESSPYFVLQCNSFEQLSVAIQQSKHALLQVALFFYPMGQNPFSRRHRAMDGWVG